MRVKCFIRKREETKLACVWVNERAKWKRSKRHRTRNGHTLSIKYNNKICLKKVNFSRLEHKRNRDSELKHCHEECVDWRLHQVKFNSNLVTKMKQKYQQQQQQWNSNDGGFTHSPLCVRFHCQINTHPPKYHHFQTIFNSPILDWIANTVYVSSPTVCIHWT